MGLKYRFITGALLGLGFLLACTRPFADEIPRPSIPFKSDPSPLEDSGPSMGMAVLVLAALMGGGIYLARRRFPLLRPLAPAPRRLQVVERLRLTPRTTIYLLELDHREILIGQSGDHLVRIDVAESSTNSSGKPE